MRSILHDILTILIYAQLEWGSKNNLPLLPNQYWDKQGATSLFILTGSWETVRCLTHVTYTMSNERVWSIAKDEQINTYTEN